MAGTAFRNVTDLVTETLAKLGVLSPGQNIDPEDASYVTDIVDSTFRMLAQLQIIAVPDANNIPSEWFLPLSDIIAGESCSKFGAAPDDWKMLKGAGLGGYPSEVPIGAGTACLTLKQMVRLRPTYEQARAYYF
jgi:hypothetical protein